MRSVLDLVVVTFNAPRETERFFVSLGYVDVPFRLHVVDNASPEPEVRDVIRGSLGMVERLSLCERVTATFNYDNVGYARACNYGALEPLDELRRRRWLNRWRRGNHDGRPAPYLALLNADTEFRPGVASAIVAHFEANPDVGVIGPRTTNTDGRLTHAGIVRMRRADGQPQDQHRYWLSQDREQANDVMDVPTVSGATYFVRRKMWDALTSCCTYQDVTPGAQGAFLTTPHYFDETFCSYHSRAHGWRVVYLGTVKMIHVWHASSPVGSPLSDGQWRQSHDLFELACKTHDIEVPA